MMQNTIKHYFIKKFVKQIMFYDLKKKEFFFKNCDGFISAKISAAKITFFL